jgi:CheY-like chemotaxis protein
LSRVREAVAAGPRPAHLSGFDASGLTFEELIEKVSSDPLLAARVLREANSAGGPQTANLVVACSALGGDRLRDVASGGAAWGEAAVSEKLWEHSLRAAAAIFDADMPYLMGSDLINHMRTEKRLMRIPVMLMSAGRGPLLSSCALTSGASIFLPKPFTSDQLRGLLRMLESNRCAAPKLSAV